MNQQDLTQEILNRLDALAAKLGTTVEYLWPALVREQVARGWATLAVCAVGFLFLFAAVVVTSVVTRKEEGENKWGPRAFAFGLCFLIGFIPLVEFARAIPLIVAPEAAALRSLIQ